ncbi:PREDICTED: uncharacterized protein LOC107340850 isoform X1 [Acropora digitifera]|uniref:uncharacterized protein LOC107340850 isoform X1 n=1 Tax=Acropora digitifera TaxID=70779 RepID=UPI00077A3999|nr:PREDICTED: uncharacterized protein LOC107340850 isoform X1 [Acropora digitifera]
MAKSIRSKRERKKRAAKRKKLKPKVRAKLEETLGLKDKEMAVDEETKEAEGSEEPLVKVVGNQESTVVESEDVVMESEGTSQKNLKKKPRNLKRLKHKRRKKNRR